MTDRRGVSFLFRFAATTTAGLLGAGLTAFSPTPSDAADTPPRQDRPDVVLVVTDDQRLESLASMPRVRARIAGRGTTFTHAMVPTALCCPSRTSILTGRYSHDTGVYGNGSLRPGGSRLGGWRAFHRGGWERRTLAVALQRSGYRTGLFGKYLNDFAKLSPDGYRPPGWDDFSAFAGPNSAYYDYRLADGSWHGADPEDYSTDVLASRARRFIQKTDRRQPVFVMFTPYGPHRPYLPAPRHAFAVVSPPERNGDRQTPADELLGSTPGWLPPQQRLDLPGWAVRRNASARRELATLAVSQTRTLLSVDEAVASLVDTLRATGRLRNTLIVFMSDNGYLWGEHGMVGKDSPYAPATRIPLVVRWDGRVPAGATDRRLALNLDVTATVAAATGVDFPTDGLDLLGDRRRNGTVLEAIAGNGGRPAYCGWRTKRYLYVSYADGRRELFDYRHDPGEMNNLAGTAAAAEVEERMLARAIRSCDPVPPGFSW